MAGGDRNKKGKPTDYVVHYVVAFGEDAICGKKTPSIVTDGSKELGESTCLKCLKKINERNH